MTIQEIRLSLPENLYLRLQRMAQATQQPFTDIVLHAVEVGSPPSWEDAPVEFQKDLASLDRLNDAALWQIARSHRAEAEMERYQELLDKNANDAITNDERATLTQLRKEADCFTLRKAHAAALLRWRGHRIPPADKL